MEHDEYEMLIEYSEMTTFNFNSKEFQEVARDYVECRKQVNRLMWFVSELLGKFTPAKIY